MPARINPTIVGYVLLEEGEDGPALVPEFYNDMETAMADARFFGNLSKGKQKFEVATVTVIRERET